MIKITNGFNELVGLYPQLDIAIEQIIEGIKKYFHQNVSDDDIKVHKYDNEVHITFGKMGATYFKYSDVKIVNLTPHAIILNDGQRFESSDNVARISASLDKRIGNIYKQTYGDIENLSKAQDGVYYIVSSLVFNEAVKQGRKDVIAPATSHVDVIRNDQGHIVSVPGFIIP